MYILGISAFYHDAAAALIKDGQIVAAAQEERFTRIKNDDSFPANAIAFCLQQQHITVSELDLVVFYEKPFLKFERLLETYLAFAPNGIVSFIKAISVWSKKKLFIKKIIKDELKKIGGGSAYAKNILFSEHHLSHAAGAYYSSPFSESAVLVIDAVGEAATTSIFTGNKNQLTCIREMNFPHSVGLLYSAFTYFLGFKVNSGEYKLMGLAPYGNINSEQTRNFKNIITGKLCTIFDDGSIYLDQQYFNYAVGLTMVNDRKWEGLFGIRKRKEKDTITDQHCDLALAIQIVTEDIVIKLATEAKRLTGSKNLCIAGGVALNCVANSKLQNEGIFENIYIQPASGDAGGAIGAALSAYHVFLNKDKQERLAEKNDVFTGPSFSDQEILHLLQSHYADFKQYNEEDLYKTVAGYIDEGNIIGWFQGGMEFGPRALGNRSIIADPRNNQMQQKLNLKIKFREGFRPFAPAVLEEKAKNYFTMINLSPHMLFVYPVKDFCQSNLPTEYDNYSLDQKLKFQKSALPAITHADGSARVQTVSKTDNLKFWKLLSAFEERTGCAVLINTSFNVRGEPIVCSPKDALQCFMNTEMDILVLNNYVLIKNDQKRTTKLAYNIQAFND
ncbi:MAG: carbamoyltransferase N-terminal domain-containing protein [Ferruginibacter sp.]